jgi:hypothetical protein
MSNVPISDHGPAFQLNFPQRASMRRMPSIVARAKLSCVPTRACQLTHRAGSDGDLVIPYQPRLPVLLTITLTKFD